jgi:tRNA 2-thiouridine synthesizing protein A
MLEIKCFGDICPVPLLKINNALKKMQDKETLIAIVDHSCVVESIRDYFKTSSNQITIEEVMNGVWEIVIIKRD